MVNILTVHCISTPLSESVRPCGDQNAQRSTSNVQRSRAPDIGARRSLLSLELPNFRTLELPRSAFTVLELLIVMGVLSVLLSILLPVFHTARKATLNARAKIEATALAQAVVQYKNVYGYWPGMVRATATSQLSRNEDAFVTPDWPLVSNYSNSWFTVKDSSGKEVNYITDNTLYRSLLPFDTSHSGTEKNLNPLNPQRIRFISLSNETDPQKASLPDPWGNQYIVVMGLNPSSSFVQKFTRGNGDVFQTLAVSNLTAFAICLGPEGSNSTNLIFSAGVTQ